MGMALVRQRIMNDFQTKVGNADTILDTEGGI